MADAEAAEHLLEEDQDGVHELETGEPQLTDIEHGRVRRLLYTSHFLSTWNSRVFEFGAFLFLANIYPHTLLPASVYALSRAASAAVLSPWLGSYIDSTNRLHAVRVSIIGQRGAVALSCIGLFLMTQFELLRTRQLYAISFLVVLSLLACVEKLCWILNTISVERDWVVTVAGSNEERLRLLNSQMRRIDLFCKLIGPMTIAFVDSASSKAAIIATGAMTASSVPVEYFAIARVYKVVPGLRKPSSTRHNQTSRPSTSRLGRIRNIFSATATYIRHQAFLPSFSLALVYLTVLSFNGQMITYLVALGIKSGLIGVLRGVSAMFELSATWIAPKIMTHIGPVRSGIWFLNWEIVCVVVACLFFWLDGSATLTAVGTVCAVIASRIGLWGFDLSAQIIIQEEVEPELRGSFSSQEFALQQFFEMLAFASTIVFPRPNQFKYPATVSAAAVALAGIFYATFVRARRGHLMHFSRCVDRNGQKDHHHWWMGYPRAEDPADGEELMSRA